jgi:hypothetical protein
MDIYWNRCTSVQSLRLGLFRKSSTIPSCDVLISESSGRRVTVGPTLKTTFAVIFSCAAAKNDENDIANNTKSDTLKTHFINIPPIKYLFIYVSIYETVIYIFSPYSKFMYCYSPYLC